MKFIAANWPAPKNIKAYTTTRQGWGGRQPYHSDKMYYDAEHPDYCKESQDLRQLLQLPNEPIWITQHHGTTVIEAIPANIEQAADASFSRNAKQVCSVTTADCLPVLICNQQGTIAAAIHAGWRGLAAGIIENTLRKLDQPSNELLIWLGPAIGPQKFEVGNDVYEAFTKSHPEAAQAFKPHTENKWLADLYTLARLRLQKEGITQIYGGDFCTYSQSDLFFSYRRDKGLTGRMASLIWMTD